MSYFTSVIYSLHGNNLINLVDIQYMYVWNPSHDSHIIIIAKSCSDSLKKNALNSSQRILKLWVHLALAGWINQFSTHSTCQLVRARLYWRKSCSISVCHSHGSCAVLWKPFYGQDGAEARKAKSEKENKRGEVRPIHFWRQFYITLVFTKLKIGT